MDFKIKQYLSILQIIIQQNNLTEISYACFRSSHGRKREIASPFFTTSFHRQIFTTREQNSSRQTIRHLLSSPATWESFSRWTNYREIHSSLSATNFYSALERESRRIINVHLESNPFSSRKQHHFLSSSSQSFKILENLKTLPFLDSPSSLSLGKSPSKYHKSKNTKNFDFYIITNKYSRLVQSIWKIFLLNNP